MPKPRATKRPKKEESEDESGSSDSGPEDRNPPPKAKASSPAKKGAASSNTSSKAELAKNEQGDYFWDLARNRRITVRTFKGKTLIDVREYYEKDGKTLPGKKGISLSAGEWQKLKDRIPEIDQAIQEV